MAPTWRPALCTCGVILDLEFPRSCFPRTERRGAARGSAIQGLGKGGSLPLVIMVQAAVEEVHRLYFKPRHKPEVMQHKAYE